MKKSLALTSLLTKKKAREKTALSKDQFRERAVRGGVHMLSLPRRGNEVSQAVIFRKKRERRGNYGGNGKGVGKGNQSNTVPIKRPRKDLGGNQIPGLRKKEKNEKGSPKQKKKESCPNVVLGTEKGDEKTSARVDSRSKEKKERKTRFFQD